MRSGDSQEWLEIGERLEERGLRLAIADRLLEILRQPEEAGYSESDRPVSDEAKED